MQVYHGSYTEIIRIDLIKSLSNKDFGRGFYVTKNRKHAENWAKVMGRKHHTEGYVTEFTFYERAFTDTRYRVLRFSEYNEDWLDFVILNRDESTSEQRHDFDIVEGPIADDKVANRINDYLANLITKADFLKELRYHEDTHQICFCTLKSLQMLKRQDKTTSINIVHITEPLVAALMVDRGIDEVVATDLFYSSATFAKLSNKSTNLYQNTWQEIYDKLKHELPKIKQ
ncbi:MAG: DUF3990 domain-containing protein [Prevotellaceae bacterium]|jgi:hypothetical protein|nr:DUF3990 domain-containing protein [Prevotellaceae bacterium]